MRARLDMMAAALEGKSHLHRIGALFHDTVLLRVGGEEFFIAFEKGRVRTITEGPSKKIAYQFSFSTDEDALRRFWKPIPEPGFHDLFAMAKIGRLSIEGDVLRLVKNLRFVKEFMALGRDFEGSAL